ncbi:MAG: hypothetical protein PHY93_15130 [Bacteriovorax sp.]|nr:hypothetical protein [Bacteriovorax sp.]
MGIGHGNITAVLAKAIQELYGQLKAVVSRVIGLEGKDIEKDRAIASVKAENVQLKARVDKAEKENASTKIRLEKIEKALNLEK